MALLPILTTVIPVCLGPKGYMAVPCYVTKEHIKRRGPPYHTVAVRKMEDMGSSFVSVAPLVKGYNGDRNENGSGQPF